MVADEFEGTRDVETVLTNFVGQRVQIMAHHRPNEPHDSTRWGGGSCLFERAGHCPFGHHDAPQQLFAVQASGILRRDQDGWSLDRGAETLELHLSLLVGHRGQIIVLRPASDEKINERVSALQEDSLDTMPLEQLSSKLVETRDLIAEINRLKDEIDV